MDLISRQAAIDAILHNQEVYSNNFGNDPIDKYTIAIIDNDAQTIAQLPSAQPKQTDCEYCHEDSDGFVLPIEKNSHAYLVRRGRTMKLRVCFKGGHSECDILFCPMCGRRLNHG